MPLSVDNAAIHHTQEAVDAIHATGAMVIFLPPYSPDQKHITLLGDMLLP